MYCLPLILYLQIHEIWFYYWKYPEYQFLFLNTIMWEDNMYIIIWCTNNINIYVILISLFKKKPVIQDICLKTANV